MTSRERVAAALRREEPDRVPYCELWYDRAIVAKLLGRDAAGDGSAYDPKHDFTVDEAKAIAARLHMDNVFYVLRPPVYAETGEGADGRTFIGDGQIKTMADLDMVELPDPEDDATYADAVAFAEQKGDYSAWFITRAGIFPVIHSLGIEGFCIALHENRPLVEALLDRYTHWACAVARRAGQLGFDVFATADDVAFKTGPFFSPKVFRDVVVPRLRLLADAISIPWVVHSDGDIEPFLSDFAGLGVAGVHPIEHGAMDICSIKREYGDRLCLLGNVDLDLLARGTPEQVEREVRGLIRDVAPGGGYIASSGNSLASYLKPENVLAMCQAIQDYGQYPIEI